MFPQGTVSARLVGLVSVAFAACVSAVLANIAIDVVGDFALARDAYDDVAHGSRATVAVLSLAILLALGVLVLWSAFVDRRDGRSRARALLARMSGRGMWPFGAGVAGATLALLVGMEAVDTLLQRGRVDDAGDLLGGSIPLALALTLPIAIATAFAIRGVLGALLASCRAFVNVTCSFLARFVDAARARGMEFRRPRIARAALRSSLLARKAGKRAPPLPPLASAVA